MEGLIPFVIMLILGALFNSGKKKVSEEKKQPTKPFTAEKTEQDNPIKKLKEMSREIYKEIQQEFEVEEKRSSQPVKQRREVAVEVKVDEPVREPRVKARVAITEGRQRNEHTKKKQQASKKQLVPTTSDEIMKGIIFSEIIGPPKSKR